MSGAKPILLTEDSIIPNHTTNLTCATCNQPIANLGSAVVEWEVPDRGATGFKIIHDIKSSPLGREGCSWHVYAGRDDPIEQLPASQFIDPEVLRNALVGGVHGARAFLNTLQSLSDRRDSLHWAFGKLAALGTLGAPALSEALASEDSGARRAAVLALARLGRGALPAAEALSRSLADPDEDVRFRAAFALKVLGVADRQKPADQVIEEVAPIMTEIDALEPFVASSTLTRGIINRDTNLTGEVGTDVTGSVYLAPEEDYRGGGMGSIRLFGHMNSHGLVKIISGIFDADIGMWAGRTEPL